MVDFNRDNAFSACMKPDAQGATAGNLGELTLKGRLTREFNMQVASSSTLFRGYDQGGLNQYVTWIVNTLSPLAGQTTPNFTGTLIDQHIEVP